MLYYEPCGLERHHSTLLFTVELQRLPKNVGTPIRLQLDLNGIIEDGATRASADPDLLDFRPLTPMLAPGRQTKFHGNVLNIAYCPHFCRIFHRHWQSCTSRVLLMHRSRSCATRWNLADVGVDHSCDN